MGMDSWSDSYALTGDSGSDLSVDYSGTDYMQAADTGTNWYDTSSGIGDAPMASSWDGLTGSSEASTAYGTSFGNIASTVYKSLFGDSSKTGSNSSGNSLMNGLILGAAQSALKSRQSDKDRAYAATLSAEQLAAYKEARTVPKGAGFGKAAGFKA